MASQTSIKYQDGLSVLFYWLVGAAIAISQWPTARWWGYDKKNISAQSGIVNGNPHTASNTRVFTDGSTRSNAALRTAVIGFGTYQPGWRWSLHAGPQLGKESENHIGYVISGCMMVEDPSGNKEKIGSGCAFEIVPGSHAWVIGDAPCVVP